MVGSYLESQPDGGWGWMIVAGGFYTLSMWAGFLRCSSVFFNPLILEFDVEYAEVSRLTGLFQFGYGIFCSVCPFLLKHFEARNVCIVASVTAGVSCFIASTVHNLWAIQIFLGLNVGCCLGLLLNGTFTMTGRYFRKHHHAANQLVCLGISVGPFVICPGLQMLINAYGWRGACQITSGILLNTAAASSLMRPIKLKSDLLEKQEVLGYRESIKEQDDSIQDKQKLEQLHEDQQDLNDREEFVCDNAQKQNNYCSSIVSTSSHCRKIPDLPVPSKVKRTREWVSRTFHKYHLDLFLNLVFYEFSLSWTLYSIAFYSAITYMIPFGQKVLGLSEIEASTLITAFAGGEIFSRIVYTFVFDKIPQRFRILYLVGLYFLTAISMVLFVFVEKYIGALVLSAIVGMLGGGTEAIFNTIMAQSYDIQRISAVLGFSNVIYCVVDSIAIAIIGAIVDGVGDYLVPFYIGCGSAALSSLLTYKLHRSVTLMRRRKAFEREKET